MRLAHAVALVAFAWALCAAVLAAIRRKAPPLEAAMALVVGTGFVGYFLACAVVINVQVRYVLTIWPMTALLCLLGLFLVAFARRRRTAAAADIAGARSG